jgi:hypothetical protein
MTAKPLLYTEILAKEWQEELRDAGLLPPTAHNGVYAANPYDHFMAIAVPYFEEAGADIDDLNEYLKDSIDIPGFDIGDLGHAYQDEAACHLESTDRRTQRRIDERALYPHALSMKVGFYKWLISNNRLTQAGVNELRNRYLGTRTTGWWADQYEYIYRRRLHAAPTIASTEKRKQTIVLTDDFGTITTLGIKSKRKQQSIMKAFKIDPSTKFNDPPLSTTLDVKKQKQYMLHQQNRVCTYFIDFMFVDNKLTYLVCISANARCSYAELAKAAVLMTGSNALEEACSGPPK